MRTIKFRAWDKYCEEMVYDTTERIFENYPEESIMQFTGLKDKNGKEIYEGDIVHSENEGAYSVVFDTAGLWAIEVYNEHFNPEYGSSTPRNDNELLSNALTDYKMEVIGNIYENKNLLK